MTSRRSVQRVFLGCALLLGALVLVCLWQWTAARRTMAQLETQTTLPTLAGAASASAPLDGDPRVMLAQASQLRLQGRVDDAVRMLQLLAARTDVQVDLARDVRYNLGNALLALALQSNTRGDEDRALTLVELSKQRYREVLRGAPHDWDARHNLEKALRLAPENDAPPEGERPNNVQRIQVEMRGIRDVDLP